MPILVDPAVPVVVRDAQRQLGRRCVAIAPGICNHTGGNIHRHLTDGVWRHIERVNCDAVAAGKAAGRAVPDADFVNGKARDRLAERDRHGDRRVEPHLSARACGRRDASSGTLTAVDGVRSKVRRIFPFD